MKQLPFAGIVAAVLMLAVAPASGQNADTTRSRQVQKEQLVDRDGDGIPDKSTGQGERMKRGKDRFVDKDGDGICDGRARGLGLRSRGAGARMKGGKR